MGSEFRDQTKLRTPKIGDWTELSLLEGGFSDHSEAKIKVK